MALSSIFASISGSMDDTPLIPSIMVLKQEVLGKIYDVCIPVNVSIWIPNSLTLNVKWLSELSLYKILAK
jgi:hypothetical protein